jgi:hypothetical protein
MKNYNFYFMGGGNTSQYDENPRFYLYRASTGFVELFLIPSGSYSYRQYNDLSVGSYFCLRQALRNILRPDEQKPSVSYFAYDLEILQNQAVAASNITTMCGLTIFKS